MISRTMKVNQQKNNADDSRSTTFHVEIKAPKSFLSRSLSMLATDLDPVSSRRGDVTMKRVSVNVGATETVTERLAKSFNSLQVADDYVELADADVSVSSQTPQATLPFQATTTTGTQEYFSAFMTYKITNGAKEELTFILLSVASMEQRPRR
jgi:hypothetical protein